MTDFCLHPDIEQIASRLGGAAKELNGKTLLLTGAGGFLGRYFTQVLAYLNQNILDNPCTVIAMDNFITTGAKNNKTTEQPYVEFVQHDVIKPFKLDRQVDIIIHAAGIASPFYYRAFPLETLEVATIGTKNMLELATQHDSRFTFFSSSEIYGDPDPKHVPMQESYRGNVSVAGPRACYDEGKRLGETLCYIFHVKHGTATNVIRPFNIYGPGMQETDYRVLPNFASLIKAKRPLHVYGSGRQTRTFCYIVDAMVGFMLTIIRGVPGEAYNIGNPEPEISVLELIKRMEEILNKKLDYHVIEYPDSYPADEPQRRCPDIRKARLQLKYEPVVDLDEGLRRFLTWSDKAYKGST